jgi:hypothetical protein
MKQDAQITTTKRWRNKEKQVFIEWSCLQKNIYEILMQFWKVCGVDSFKWFSNNKTRDLLIKDEKLTSWWYLWTVSFIGGGNWSTWRKQPSCHKQLLNIITQWCIEYTSPEWDSKVLTFRSSIIRFLLARGNKTNDSALRKKIHLLAPNLEEEKIYLFKQILTSH